MSVVGFPSIEKFRHAIDNVRRVATYVGHNTNTDRPIYDDSVDKPTLTFHGTVKLHGSNTGIVYLPDGTTQFQSRNCVLSRTSDFAGFVAHMTKHSEHVARLKSEILVAGGASPDDVSPVVAVFGEWCGDTIQSGVALAQLPKMFVVFAAVDHKWVNMTALPRIVVENEPARIYHIHTFGGWTINIDFNLPESSQPELERLTALVEAECPAAKYFGVTGVGEGIVWNCVAAGYTNLKFKVKGELHDNPGPTIGKGTTKAAATHPDVVQSIQAFVDECVSEARLQQGLTILDESGLPRSLMSMGYFIKWVQGDVLKEEADTIAANALNERTLIAPIAAKARDWFKQAVAAYT